MQKLLLFATTTHFTLKARVRIYFHITSPNCSPFPLVCNLKYGVGVGVRCWHVEVVRTEWGLARLRVGVGLGVRVRC